jgi:hypothetical protein
MFFCLSVWRSGINIPDPGSWFSIFNFQLSKNYRTFYKKNCQKALKKSWDPGSEIRDPGSRKNPFRIPDPGVLCVVGRSLLWEKWPWYPGRYSISERKAVRISVGLEQPVESSPGNTDRMTLARSSWRNNWAFFAGPALACACLFAPVRIRSASGVNAVGR